MLDIYQSLRGVAVDFISPAREFVTQGPVTKIAARSGEKQLRHLFLVNIQLCFVFVDEEDEHYSHSTRCEHRRKLAHTPHHASEIIMILFNLFPILFNLFQTLNTFSQMADF